MTVLPVTSEEYGQSRAVRPRNSRLDTAKLAAAGVSGPLPDWQDALARYLGRRTTINDRGVPHQRARTPRFSVVYRRGLMSDTNDDTPSSCRPRG